MPRPGLNGVGIPGVDTSNPGFSQITITGYRALGMTNVPNTTIRGTGRFRATSPRTRGSAHDQGRRAGLPARDRLPQLAAQQRHLQLQRAYTGNAFADFLLGYALVGEPVEVGDAELPLALHPLLRAGRLARDARADAQPRAALRAEPAGRGCERRHRQLRPRHRSGQSAPRAGRARKATTGVPRAPGTQPQAVRAARRLCLSASRATRRWCAAAPASSTPT